MEFTSPVIRLREVPAAPTHAETVYRYDRKGLVEALNKARSAGSKR